MEAALMQQAPTARWRCMGDASLAGHSQQHLAGAVRLRVAWHAGNGSVRANRLGPVLALISEVVGERAMEGEEEDAAVRLFVGLPMDAVVSDGHGVSHPRAVSATLRALKLLSIDGVELTVSCAVVQPGSGAWFEWAGYRAVAAMVRDARLYLHVSLYTDGDALLEWVANC